MSIGQIQSKVIQFPVKNQSTLNPGNIKSTREYIEGMQGINIATAVLAGTAIGIHESAGTLNKKPGRLNFLKALFKRENIGKIAPKIGKNILLATGMLTIAGFIIEKAFKYNEKYEDIYNRHQNPSKTMEGFLSLRK